MKQLLHTAPHNNRLYQSMVLLQDKVQAEHLSHFFKTGKGQYGEGDCFLGVKVPQTRAVVKTHWKTTDYSQIEQCLASPFHEVRLAALLVLVEQYRHADDEVARRRCVEFYLSHLEAVNNWDLVDLSCYDLLGHWLLDHDRSLLYELVEKGDTLWKRRIGIVSSMQFLRHNQLDDTYALAELMIAQPAPLHDLLQKATGWLLREAGKRDMQRLSQWLRPRCQTLPRTLLRYAIEKFPEPERQRFLKGDKMAKS